VIYWDTSCVIKLYSEESDSPGWQKLLLSSQGDRVSSALLEVELAFALQMKERRRELVAGGADKLIALFRLDVEAGRFSLFPLGRDVFIRAIELASRLPKVSHLRTLDALHLATAEILRCNAIATADDRMSKAARHLGIKPAS